MNITFSIEYSITIDNDDLDIIQHLTDKNEPAKICKHLMDKYTIGLPQANYIRKVVINPKITEFYFDLDIK